MENAILATVSDVRETSNNNPEYRLLLFEPKVIETDTEFRVDSYNVQVVSVETANRYSKSLKAGKSCKCWTTPKC